MRRSQVMGPGDEQYVHPASDEDDEGGSMLSVLLPPHIDADTRMLRIHVYDAQDMPRMDAKIGTNNVASAT